MSEALANLRAAIDRSANVKFFISNAQSIPDTAATVNRAKMNLAAWHAGEVRRLLGEAITTGIQSGVNPGQMDRFVEMTKNAAGLPQIFGNIEVAAEMVGKSFSGKFELFERLGFTFSDNASQAQKLDELFQQLATRGGGQLEERGKTLHGQFKTVTNATAEFFKTLGKGASDTGLVQSVTYGLATSLGTTTKAIRGLLEVAPTLKIEIKGVGEEMLTAEQRAELLQKKLEEIRKGPAEAAKKREEFGTKLSKENQAKAEAATDAAGLETAKVNALESMGLIKPEEAERQRRKISSGLESTKQKIAIGEFDSQIANRKVGLDESHASVASAASKLQEERRSWNSSKSSPRKNSEPGATLIIGWSR